MASEAEIRLNKLEKLYLEGFKGSGNGSVLSVESLMDTFVVLYDECSASTLRREKSVSDFLDRG